jgi:hypothetical protein
MSRTIILRFRDLTVEEGGTISEHIQLLKQFGEVWWGWWMKQWEIPPRPLFQEIEASIEVSGPLIAYVLNAGASKLYRVRIADIRVAPPGDRLETPDPEKSASYYHRGRYPAWFLLSSIEEIPFSSVRFIYESFPTRPEYNPLQFMNVQVGSLEQLRGIDVTLWVVHDDSL